MGEHNNTISVILIGLNACDFIQQCLKSLYESQWDGYGYELIYIDNASTDNTLEMVAEHYPDVVVIANKENIGFCRAANQGGREASGDFLYFINDDTIVLDNAIAATARVLEENDHIGIVGSRLLYPDMTEQWSGRRFPSLLNGIFGRRSFVSRLFPNAHPVKRYLYKDKIDSNEAFEVDWVSAAAMIVMKTDFTNIGGFAEDYYYWHEPIICDRMRDYGKRVYLHPQSRIIHYEGHGSGKRSYAVRRFHIIDFHKGAYRCYCEHYRLGQFAPRRWLAAAGLVTRASIKLAANRVGYLLGKD